MAITPSGVHELVRNGHEVYVEKDAGVGSSILNEDYVAAGATILDTADDVWGTGDLILKVKEPIAAGVPPDARGPDPLHLPAPRRRPGRSPRSWSSARSPASPTRPSSCPTARLPLLAPMSEVAGRLAPQVGAHTLMRAQGGRGILMGGVSGVYAAKVVVIGAGVSGMNAAAIALGMQAEVLLLDRDIAKPAPRRRDLPGPLPDRRLQRLRGRARDHATPTSSSAPCSCPGAKAPTLVTNEQVSRMKPGSVLVDISIDQGGCFEDSRPTTHADPTYQVHNSVFYCVANMPGAVPHT